MPRGRFISKSFYDNYRLNALPIECHHLFGGIDVVCADREGRCKGQAKWINNQIFSLRNYSDEQVEAWLTELWQSKDDETGLGLIERYEVNGRSYIWIPGFDKHQKGRHKDREAESDIPPPTDKLLALTSEGKPLPDVNPALIQTVEVFDRKRDKIAGMIKYYEDELGKTLTPIDYEKLKDFAGNYPDGWFEKAVDEAKTHKPKAPMSYIGKILETWQANGGADAENRTRRTSAHSGKSTTDAQLKDGLTTPLD